MIKILFTINYLNNGGPSRVLQNIIKSLDKSKYKISILTIIDENEKNIVEEYKKQGIEVIEFKLNKRIRDVLKNRKKIIDYVRNLNPDIIHTHGIVTTILFSTKCIKMYKITTIHNNMYEDYKYAYGKVKGFIINILHTKNLKKFDNVICCSKTSYEILDKKLKNVSYITNGIDIIEPAKETREKIRDELGIMENDIVYIYGGVINKRKRVVELVNMFNNNLKENEYLLILGEGPQKEIAEKVQNSKIKFLGFKTNIVDYLSASDIYVSYSSSEGFSISIIEALSCGLLCLLSDIPSHKECFEIDKNYYIGEIFNNENFDNKKDIISNNLTNIKKDKIKQFQNEYLSASTMTRKYERVYEEKKWKKE